MKNVAPVAPSTFFHVEFGRRFEPTLSADEARVAIVRGRKCLVSASLSIPILVAPHEIPDSVEAIFLGQDEAERSLFAWAVDRSTSEEAALAALGLSAGEAVFRDLMFDLGRLPRGARELVLTALGLVHWSAEHTFCNVCGAGLAWDETARTKLCLNPVEPHRHFPRLDPATIMLVHDGDRAVLGRQSTWPSGMYSTLAGFVEPGESLEEAVAREVYEEVGLRVDEIAYFASEPWPFPRSLMLGFFARAQSFDIRIGDELEDARWYSRAELLALQTSMIARRPYLDTIARRLIDTWLAGRHSR